MKMNENGRSMVEMLGVIAIIGVLSLAGLAGYQKAMVKHRTNTTINQMVTIVNNVRATFVNQQTTEKPYADLSSNKVDATRQLVDMNVFPEEMVVDRTAPDIRNVYKGQVWVERVDDGASFNVEFENLPDNVAVAMGTIDWGTEDASGLQEVLISPATEESN